MDIKNLLQEAIVKLKEAKIDEASLKAKLVMCYVLGIQKEQLVTQAENEVNSVDEKKFLGAIYMLTNNIPVEHITNNKDFMKLNFYVDENVLIPRQDTEILVEEVIKRCNSGKILDLCTGSGAIAVSLSKYIPNIRVYASDISQKALETAKRNAKNNDVDVTFIESNIFENIQDNDFDVIVSNPPYIETNVIESLSEEVKKEPHIALDGGIDGLDFYRTIASEAKKHLKKGGLLALEIGYNQAEAVTKLLEEYNNIEVIKDLAGNDRVIIARGE